MADLATLAVKTSLTSGQQQAFTVAGTDSNGNPVQLVDLAVQQTGGLDSTVTVNPDGTGGVITAGTQAGDSTFDLMEPAFPDAVAQITVTVLPLLENLTVNLGAIITTQPNA